MIASLYQSTSACSGKPLPPGPISVSPCKAGQNPSLYEVTTVESHCASNSKSVTELIPAAERPVQVGFATESHIDPSGFVRPHCRSAQAGFIIFENEKARACDNPHNVL